MFRPYADLFAKLRYIKKENRETCFAFTQVSQTILKILVYSCLKLIQCTEFYTLVKNCKTASLILFVDRLNLYEKKTCKLHYWGDYFLHILVFGDQFNGVVNLFKMVFRGSIGVPG